MKQVRRLIGQGLIGAGLVTITYTVWPTPNTSLPWAFAYIAWWVAYGIASWSAQK